MFNYKVLRYEKRLGNTSLEIVHDSLAKAILGIRKERRTFRDIMIVVAIAIAILGPTIIVANLITMRANRLVSKSKAEVKAQNEILEREHREHDQLYRKQADSLRLKDINLRFRTIDLEMELKRSDELGAEIRTKEKLARALNDRAMEMTERADDMTARADSARQMSILNFRKFVKERVSLLRLTALDLLSNEPRDYKRALLYAYAAYEIDDSDTNADLVRRAYSETQQLYTRLEAIHPDSATTYFNNGDKLALNTFTKSGTLLNHRTRIKKSIVVDLDNATLVRRARPMMGPRSNSNKLQGGQVTYKQAVSPTNQYFIVYNQTGNAFKVWQNRRYAFSEVFSASNATFPIISRNEKYVAYYDSKNGVDNPRLRLKSLLDSTEDNRIHDVKKDKLWEISQFNIDVQANKEYYALLRVNNRNESKKEIVLREISRNKVVTTIRPTNKTGKVLSMDFLPDSSRLFVYSERLLQIYNEAKADSNDIKWVTVLILSR